MKKWIVILYIFIYFLIILGFSVYSYTQVDLNLTISSNTLYQSFQQPMLQLGYFNRPLSASLYVFFLILLFLFYIFMLKLTLKDGILNKKLIICLIILNIGAALISYPAFSHDFFNYMFDARIVTLYHQNPYFYKALDFPGDLWIRFMHWTHRTYPYGPLWLIATLPFSNLGMGKFVATLVLFKMMFVIVYLLNIILIYKIAGSLNRNSALKGIVFFAINPLIITETLISPHNESLMLLFLLLSVYYLFSNKNYIFSLISLIASVLIKFVTVPLLPLFLIKRIKTDYQIFLKSAILLLFIPLFVEIYNREAYPWYFIPLLGINSLLSNSWILGVSIALSLGAMFRYVPFLYTGDYNLANYRLMNLFLILPILIYSVPTLYAKFKT